MPRSLLPATLTLLTAMPALAEVPTVVADLPVAQSLTAQVMGELGTPDLLLDRSADPHHAQLRPSQARAVANADLVIWTSAALSPWMAEVVDSLAEGATLELATVDGTRHAPFADGAMFEAGDDDHDHDDHDHDHDSDTADAYDPHLWLEPANAAVWLDAIAGQLAAMDPEHAETYAENARAAAAQLEGLRAEIGQILQPVGDAGLIMHHNAYGYFARAFGLNVLGTVTGGDAADPGAARIAALRHDLQDAGAVCIFPEGNHPSGFVALVAEGTDMRIGAPLDPAGMLGEPGPDLYAQTMRGLAQVIADCVAGD
ncbi:MAG: zinc ABC transporter substrate-binding protein [Rhodobacter sp.]|nr:zinc ABC transporter substrate-binding protein [Paracoccaceae bacterium]MCC0076155.1 zinc ABC transporter substrate-binding protein [Rhodobacter sp.]